MGKDHQKPEGKEQSSEGQKKKIGASIKCYLSQKKRGKIGKKRRDNSGRPTARGEKKESARKTGSKFDITRKALGLKTSRE